MTYTTSRKTPDPNKTVESAEPNLDEKNKEPAKKINKQPTNNYHKNIKCSINSHCRSVPLRINEDHLELNSLTQCNECTNLSVLTLHRMRESINHVQKKPRFVRRGNGHIGCLYDGCGNDSPALSAFPQFPYQHDLESAKAHVVCACKQTVGEA